MHKKDRRCHKINRFKLDFKQEIPPSTTLNSKKKCRRLKKTKNQ